MALFSRPTYKATSRDLDRFDKAWSLFRHLEKEYHREKDILKQTEFAYFINFRKPIRTDQLAKYYKKHHPVLFNESIKVFVKDSIERLKIDMQTKQSPDDPLMFQNAKSKIIRNVLLVSDFDLDDITNILTVLKQGKHDEKGTKVLTDQNSLIENLRRQLIIIRHISDKLSIDEKYSIIEYLSSRQEYATIEFKFVKVQINMSYLIFRLLSRRVIINNLLYAMLSKRPLLINFYFDNSSLLTNYNEQMRILQNALDYVPLSQQIAAEFIVKEELVTPSPRSFLEELEGQDANLAADYINYSLSLSLEDTELTSKLLEKMPKLSLNEIDLKSLVV